MIEWPSLADAIFIDERPERTIVLPGRTIAVRPERTIVLPGKTIVATQESNEAVMPTTVATDSPNSISIPIGHGHRVLPSMLRFPRLLQPR
jgi:hypothetical protein